MNLVYVLIVVDLHLISSLPSSVVCEVMTFADNEHGEEEAISQAQKYGWEMDKPDFRVGVKNVHIKGSTSITLVKAVVR